MAVHGGSMVNGGCKKRETPQLKGDALQKGFINGFSQSPPNGPVKAQVKSGARNGLLFVGIACCLAGLALMLAFRLGNLQPYLTDYLGIILAYTVGIVSIARWGTKNEPAHQMEEKNTSRDWPKNHKIQLPTMRSNPSSSPDRVL
ncbi:MAG: hypothetical protein HZB92_06130 [Euryarchaeota archaeon]|nr:hypothetical protein [Euryarchaeota archaeon]